MSLDSYIRLISAGSSNGVQAHLVVPGAPAGQHRALLGLHGHQLHAGLALAQVAARARDGAARAHACAQAASITTEQDDGLDFRACAPTGSGPRP